MEALPALTDKQRQDALELIRADTNLGSVAALRQAGVKGSKGQIHRLIDDELAEEMREARGWSVTAAKQALYDVAVDTEHPSWQRANALFLRSYGGPEFRDVSRHELTGRDGGPLELLARSDLSKLNDEQLERVIQALEALRNDEDDDDGAGAVALLPRA
jgi:hypothetical protein